MCGIHLKANQLSQANHQSECCFCFYSLAPGFCAVLEFFLFSDALEQ
jgi:hypothetical protein